MSKKVIDIYSPSDKKRHSSSKSKKPSSGKKNVVLFFAVFFLLAFGYFYYASYKTNITIYPEVERVTSSVDVLVKTSGSLQEGDIRGVVLSERLQDKREFEIDTVRMVEEKAEGEIKVCQKHSSSAMNFVTGTRFISDEGKYFVAKSAFTLPGRGTNEGCQMVEVEAMEAGEEHNISADSSFTLPGLLGHASYAHVNGVEFKLTKRGVKREVPDLDEESRHKAEKQMLEDLLEKGRAKIKEENEKQFFLENDDQFKVDIIERGFEEVEGDENKFLYKLDVMIRTIAISKENVTEFIAKMLPPDTIWREETEEISITFSYFDFEDGDAEAIIAFSVDRYDNIDKEGVKRSVTGLSFADAQSKIESEINAKKIILTTFPFGFSKVLEDYSRIDVKLQFDKN